MSTSISMIDIAIVIGYLLITLVIGIRAGMGRNVNKTMKDYALGNRSFTTIALTATLVASWVNGNSIMGLTTEIYNKGWMFGLVFLAPPIGVFLTKNIFANRIKHFAECISAGDITQTIFGDKSQIIVGILSFINGNRFYSCSNCGFRFCL